MGKTHGRSKPKYLEDPMFFKKLPLESMHTTSGSRGNAHKNAAIWKTRCLDVPGISVFRIGVRGPATLMTQLHRLGLRAPARCNQVGYSDSISQMERDLVHHPALLKQSLTSLIIINYTFLKDWI